MKLEFSQQIFEKYSNIRFNEYPASGSRVIAWGQTYGHDMTTPIVAFRNFATAPNKTLESRSRFSDVQYRWHQILFLVDLITNEAFTRCGKEISKLIVSEADGWNIVGGELICFALTLSNPHI